MLLRDENDNTILENRSQSHYGCEICRKQNRPIVMQTDALWCVITNGISPVPRRPTSANRAGWELFMGEDFLSIRVILVTYVFTMKEHS